MAKQKTYTQTELDSAKQLLADLPDLSRNKIGQAEALQQLKDQIIILSSQKGYTVPEIREALDSVGIKATAKAIGDLVAVRKRAPSKVKSTSE